MKKLWEVCPPETTYPLTAGLRHRKVMRSKASCMTLQGSGWWQAQDRNRALFYLLVHRPLRPVPHWLSALGITIFPDVALGRASDGVPRPVAGLTEQEEGLGRIRRQENTGLSKPHDSGLFINTPRSLVVTDCTTDYANSKECKTCFSKLNS